MDEQVSFTRRTLSTLIIATIIICIAVYITTRLKFNELGRNVVFTCTTFFDCEKEDKWATFCNGIDRILALHSTETLDRIGLWLIVNEYSDKSVIVWAAKIKIRYPFMVFVQKEKNQQGQAKSLNLILNAITPYKYWIQWEEAWYPIRECFSRGLIILECSDVTQLQMTRSDLAGKADWIDNNGNEYSYSTECYGEYCFINYSEHGMDVINSIDAQKLYDHSEWFSTWPLYSLRPSINRVRPYKALGYFNISPELWPVKFEWEYGRRFINSGCKKAVLLDGPVIRSKDHKSTY